MFGDEGSEIVWARHVVYAAAIVPADPAITPLAVCTDVEEPNFRATAPEFGDLAAYPAWVLDYVIVHELLHLQIPNHGRLWKALMRTHLGDWELAEQRLRQQARQALSCQTRVREGC